MAFETILNALWLLLGLTALLVLPRRLQGGRSSVLCGIGVSLVVATLFPVISASDDVIRIQHLERFHESQHSTRNTTSHKRATDSLIRLYEAMESPLAATPVRICFILFFAFLTVPLCEAYARQGTISAIGRSPPVPIV